MLYEHGLEHNDSIIVGMARGEGYLLYEHGLEHNDSIIVGMARGEGYLLYLWSRTQ